MNKSYAIALSGILMLSACSEQDRSEHPAQLPAEDRSTEKTAKPVSTVQTDTKVVKEEPVKATKAVPPVKSTQKTSDAIPTEKAQVEVIPKQTTSAKGAALSRDEALALAGKSGCLACHKIETKLIGPAWSDVSKRYKGDADAEAKLHSSVKSGSKGKWTKETGGMPMPANSSRVSDENIGKLVNFILSL